MTKKTKFGDLHRLLQEYGFERSPVVGPYVLFKNESADAIQAFRAHRTNELVDPMTMASVKNTLVGFGFMEEEEFESAVQQPAAKAKR